MTDAATATPSPPDAASVVEWAATQTAAFHGALATAVAAWTKTGTKPASIFAASGAKGTKRKRAAGTDGAEKEKRPMSAYNLFVRQKAAVLKESGFDPKTAEKGERTGGGGGGGARVGARRRRRRRAGGALVRNWRPWMG